MKYLTPIAAARALGVSRRYVRDLLRAGRMRGAFRAETPRGPVWQIPAPPKVDEPKGKR